MIGRFEDFRPNHTAKVKDLVDHWYIAGWNNGSLWVQPQRPVLRLMESCALLKRIQRIFRSQLFKVAIFHFDRIDTHPDHWEFVIRVLREFAKTTNAQCRIVQYDRYRDEQGKLDASNEESSLAPKTSRHPPLRLKGISVVIE